MLGGSKIVEGTSGNNFVYKVTYNTKVLTRYLKISKSTEKRELFLELFQEFIPNSARGSNRNFHKFLGFIPYGPVALLGRCF